MAKRQFEQHISSFTKGMNKELDYSLMPAEAYLHAENLRLTADENNTTGALENIKGNKIVIDNYPDLQKINLQEKNPDLFPEDHQDVEKK